MAQEKRRDLIGRYGSREQKALRDIAIEAANRGELGLILNTLHNNGLSQAVR
jgi:hypothetical protein